MPGNDEGRPMWAGPRPRFTATNGPAIVADPLSAGPAAAELVASARGDVATCGCCTRDCDRRAALGRLAGQRRHRDIATLAEQVAPLVELYSGRRHIPNLQPGLVEVLA